MKGLALVGSVARLCGYNILTMTSRQCARSVNWVCCSSRWHTISPQQPTTSYQHLKRTRLLPLVVRVCSYTYRVEVSQCVGMIIHMTASMRHLDSYQAYVIGEADLLEKLRYILEPWKKFNQLVQVFGNKIRNRGQYRVAL
jgi:hypothetical protein